jgi:hypothetical protein
MEPYATKPGTYIEIRHKEDERVLGHTFMDNENWKIAHKCMGKLKVPK